MIKHPSNDDFELTDAQKKQIHQKVREGSAKRAPVIVECHEFIENLVQLNADQFIATEEELEWGQTVRAVLHQYLVEAGTEAPANDVQAMQAAITAELTRLIHRNRE